MTTNRRPISPRALAMILALGVAAACGDPGPRTDPELLNTESPFRYPVALWDERVEGQTLLMVRVTEAGRADSAYIYRSSGHAAMDSAALAGVPELRFAPARRGDRRVEAWVRLPVRFDRAGEPAGSPPYPETLIP